MIKKTIKIGDKTETFRASAATLLYYRRAFGEDMLSKLSKLSQENMDVILLEEMAFAMTDSCKNGEDFAEWLERFDLMDMAEALPEIAELISKNAESMSPNTEKK